MELEALAVGLEAVFGNDEGVRYLCLLYTSDAADEEQADPAEAEPQQDHEAEQHRLPARERARHDGTPLFG